MSYQTLVQTIDGPQPLGVIKSDGCCPPSLCNIDYCGFICSFLQYLPKGPLWDYWRNSRYADIINSDGACVVGSCYDNPCLTIIDHAIYTAKKLLHVLQNPLQTAIWEASPLTAFNTRQYWLDTFGWEDCFEGPSAFRKLGFPTPYQAVCNALLPHAPCSIESTLYQMSPSIDGNQNPVIDISEQVKAACPADLVLAVQYGILVALKRLEVGIIPTLAAINFVLAPLGVEATISTTDNIGDCAGCNQMSGTIPNCVMADDCSQMTGTSLCAPYQPCIGITLSLINAGRIASGPGITVPLLCETVRLFGSETILASYHFAGIAMPVTIDCPEGTIAGDGTIYPALMAAECIVLSIVPPNVNYTLHRNI
jgi:hypothetical protein